MFDFKGKVALITGASRGIGASIAEAFAAAGCSLIINAVNGVKLTETAKKMKEKYGVEILEVSGDVSDENFVKEMISKAVEKFSKIDFLINNAGITRDNILMRMKNTEWDDVLNVNLRSVYLMTREILRPMLKNGGGRIVNISSIIGQVGGSGQSNYAASKAGVIAFSKSVAAEYASKNVLVNSVCPGFIETDMTEVLSEDRKQMIRDFIPLKRVGKVQEISGLVLFLCSDMSSYITGQSIGVNGGLYMQ